MSHKAHVCSLASSHRASVACTVTVRGEYTQPSKAHLSKCSQKSSGAKSAGLWLHPPVLLNQVQPEQRLCVLKAQAVEGGRQGGQVAAQGLADLLGWARAHSGP